MGLELAMSRNEFYTLAEDEVAKIFSKDTPLIVNIK